MELLRGRSALAHPPPHHIILEYLLGDEEEHSKHKCDHGNSFSSAFKIKKIIQKNPMTSMNGKQCLKNVQISSVKISC